MSDLILHIGTRKTGSTSLQRFLYDNRDKLSNYGICYPEFTPQPGPTRLRNGVYVNQLSLALAVGEDPKKYVCDSEENWDKLTKAFSSEKKVLLTDEDFSCNAGCLTDDAPPSELYWTSLAQTLRNAGAQDVTIVVYLRRQDDWLASHWRESVKSGRCDISLEEYCDEPMIQHIMDYAGMLERARTAFGKGTKTIVRRYEKNSFEGGDIYHDFCKAADISWEDEYIIPQKEFNKSLSFDVAEALRPFANAAPPNEFVRKEVIVPLARKLSAINPDPINLTPFDEETTRTLIKPYMDGNRKIADKYFDGDELFPEEYGGRPVWIPNEERIAEFRTVFEDAIRKNTCVTPTSGRLISFIRKLRKTDKR